MNPRSVDRSKPTDVVAVGSWTNFDHLFRVDKLPLPGDTVRIISSIENIETIYWGGCALNNVTAAAKLGAKAGLVTVVGEDFVSRGYYKYLESLDVDVSGLIIVNGGYSGHSFLFADPHGDAICISHVGVSDTQEEYEPDQEALAAAKVVVINYRFDKFTYLAAKYAHLNGSITIASGNLMTSAKYVEEILQVSDILICTSHELTILLQKITQGNDISSLFDIGIQAVIETHGVEGSIIRTLENENKITAILSTSVVDPVGAGDGFAGGVATGLAFGLNLDDAVRLGTVVASHVVEAIGCQTNQPSFFQAKQRLAEWGITLPIISDN
jgi:nucleoside kinase